MHRNMRVVAAALVLLVIGIGVGLAQVEDDPFGDPASRGPKAPRPAPKIRAEKRPVVETVPRPLLTEAEVRIERALEEKTKLQFQDNTLGEVVDYLKDMHKIDIRLDKKALEEMDIGSETPVTCVLEGVSLHDALQLMLRDLDLAYMIRNEVLLITTHEAVEENRRAKVYDVADLVTYRDERGEIWNDYDSLAELITFTIKPESWTEFGGEGTIQCGTFSTAKIMVVKQTDDVHAQIVQLLSEIRYIAAQTPGDGLLPLKHRSEQVSPRGMGGGMGMSGGMGMGGMGGGMGGMGGGAPSGTPATPAGGAPGAGPKSPGGAAGPGMGGGFM
jgi:hypothetical protein